MPRSGWRKSESDRRLPDLVSVGLLMKVARLGPEPMALLFERVAKPLGAKDTPGCWLAGRRLVANDGTCLTRQPTTVISGARG